MRRSGGFVSFIVLATGLMVVALALMISYYVGRSGRLESEYIRSLNYREIVYPAMNDLMKSAPTATVNIIKNYALTLGDENITITKSADFSTDNNFRVLSVVATGENNRFGLRNYTFIPTTAVQTRASNYIFSSYTTPSTSTKNNMNGAEYSTGNYFNQPLYDKDLCATVDLEEIKRIGFGQYIYYHPGDLSIPKANYKCNSMVIVDGNLTIAAGTTFSGRMIFLVGQNGATSGGRTTIGSNVTMTDGLILTQAALTVGSGCNLTGHFRSSSSVVVNGKGTFVKRSDAGRPFQSIAFVF